MRQRTLYIGSVEDDGTLCVKAERVTCSATDEETPTHAGVGTVGKYRWRYPLGCDRVFWWVTVPTAVKESVDAWLAKRGFTKLKHVVMCPPPNDDEKGWKSAELLEDISHGCKNIPARWRCKGKAREYEKRTAYLKFYEQTYL